MNQNPYSLMFGKEPAQRIDRAAQMNLIMETFMEQSPSQQIFVLTGVRGSGKTVLMNEIAKSISEEKGWIVAPLNPERDMLTLLVARLTGETTLVKLFQEAKINLSFFGIGLEVSGSVPVSDPEVALTKMLHTLKKHGKRVLITVDEAINSHNMRIFASAFQILVGQDLPVFLLMTGLYENINSLQNEKSMTFLYRAPKVELKPCTSHV